MEATMSNARAFFIAIGLAGAVLMFGSPSHAQVSGQDGVRAADFSARYRVRYYRSYGFFRPIYYRGSSYSYRRGMRSSDWVAIHGAAK
jgi:hypothetical protein